MRLRKLLWISLACTAFALADDALKTQLGVCDGIPGQSAPNAYRILFVGDSITRHGVSDWTRQSLGWDHLAGMAASSADKDYVHLLAARIQGTMLDRTVEIYYDAQVTPNTNRGFKAGTFADKHARLQTLKDDFRPNLVVVQLGEHEEPQRGVAFMQESCDRLLASLKALVPDSDIICAGVWVPGDKTGGHDGYATGWGADVESAMRTSCLKYGIPFASVRDFALDPSCRGWGSNAGVKWHPNDKGMAGYASALYAAFERAQPFRASSSLALPDSQGNAVSQVMYSVDGVTFSPVPATITVNSSTQITATLDTRNAVAGVTYSVAVWNPPGPQKSNADKTLKVAASSCP